MAKCEDDTLPHSISGRIHVRDMSHHHLPSQTQLIATRCQEAVIVSAHFQAVKSPAMEARLIRLG